MTLLRRAELEGLLEDALGLEVGSAISALEAGVGWEEVWVVLGEVVKVDTEAARVLERHIRRSSGWLCDGVEAWSRGGVWDVDVGLGGSRGKCLALAIKRRPSREMVLRLLRGRCGGHVSVCAAVLRLVADDALTDHLLGWTDRNTGLKLRLREEGGVGLAAALRAVGRRAEVCGSRETSAAVLRESVWRLDSFRVGWSEDRGPVELSAEVVSALSRCELSSLEVVRTGLGDAGLREILRGGASVSRLRVLDVRGCGLRDDGLQVLCDVVARGGSMCALRELRLGSEVEDHDFLGGPTDNKFTARGDELLAAVLVTGRAWPRLELLDLGLVMHGGVGSVMGAIRGLRQIRELLVGENGPVDAVALGTALGKGACPHLRRLMVDTDEEGFAEVCRGLWNGGRLWSMAVEVGRVRDGKFFPDRFVIKKSHALVEWFGRGGARGEGVVEVREGYDDHRTGVDQVLGLTFQAFVGDATGVEMLLSSGAAIDVRTRMGHTPLHLAAQEGHTDIVRLLLEYGASVEEARDDGCTPLYVASQKGHLEVVSALLGAGASVDQAMNDGATPLYIASEEGHLDVVSALLEAGASVDQARDDGCTPLFMALQMGHLDVVSALLGARASVDQADEDGCTPLFIASDYGHLEMVSALLEAGASVDQADDDGCTPLFIASQEGHMEVVSALLEAGASVDQAKDNGCTPLYIASHQGHLDVVSALLGAGASVNQAKDNGCTPLFVASQMGHLDVVSALLGARASVDQADEDGCTPLFIASDHGHLDVVSALLEAGASVDQAINDGCTPLFIASQEGYLEVVSALSGAGASVDQADNDDWVSLIIAASQGHTDICSVLLDAGSPIDHVDNDGDTALAQAVFSSHLSTARLLLDRGANPNTRGEHGNSPLHIAVQDSANPSLIRLLLARGADPTARNDAGETPQDVASGAALAALEEASASSVSAAGESEEDGAGGGSALATSSPDAVARPTA